MRPVTGVARWLGLVDDPREHSVLGAILKLFTRGHAGIGLLLLIFSVLFPIAKLVLLRAALADARSGKTSRVDRVAAALGKYSMVDVFVIALLVVASQSFPGGTTIEVRWGAYAFAGAALLSTAVGAGLARR